ncbi:uncharacterized protein [Drosophila bipectinata]|uniref:uncharacterized protein n=1 Tax=Drosophila bipectinata TaxID=42026 RepID=UPI001C8A7B5D|nr:uncharacterized protein LOC108124702 [Drosophila bipectinata]
MHPTIARMKLDMKSMANDVWILVEEWQHHVHRGKVMLQHIESVYSRIFSGENQLDDIQRPRELRTMERRIRLLYQRLDVPLKMMQNTLKLLTDIRDKATEIQRRMTLWMLDDHFEDYTIRRSLTTQKLLEMLNFLRKRYDAEWEVKEMVVLNLPQITTSYDLEILREAWGQSVHIGGELFERKILEYYHAIGRRTMSTMFTNPPMPFAYGSRRIN